MTSDLEEGKVEDTSAENDVEGNDSCRSPVVNQQSERPDLHPPRSRSEKLRDRILRKLDHPFFQALGIIVLVLVIADGAFFFFLLMGWHAMCTPTTDCEPRNWWYNCSIQILNILFTYMSLESMPWRCTNFVHIAGWGCPHRENAPGHDLYGQMTVDHDPWFHIPLRRRMGITLILLLNCLAQFANQVTRIRFYSFELQNEYPGNLWTNVFFATSFICAGIAGMWMGYEVWRLRKAHPGKFGASKVERAWKYYEEHLLPSLLRGSTQDAPNDNDNDEGNIRASPRAGEGILYLKDPTREAQRRYVLKAQRSTMRLWAM